ncbi:DUF3713 domain-containing protein [Mycoplasma tullyi]|uniref:DUF3713 domain-containing protein n=1 Tax=Mycoplasma tullyi TaxID=1612150 RepID=A0A7D7U6D4_9MOLU|nr:DUF3713 domain-containing protein [Mycoplasma tullyi]QMT98403.1 DUF3713 domain-containing protein [Mycoplasma tullyi]
MSHSKNKKYRIVKQVSFLSLISLAGVLVSSCGTAYNANQLLMNKFQTGFSNNGNNQNLGFVGGDSSNILGGQKDQAKTVLATALKNNQGFQSLLSSLLADSLANYYKNSKSSVLSNKYQNFSDDVNDQLNTSIEDNKKIYGNNFMDLIQTQLFDPNGGTKESYLQNQLNQKISNDFFDSIFKDSYLNYAPTMSTDADGFTVYSNLTKIPSRAILNDPANWANIRFTDGGFSASNNEQTNNEFLAQIQAFAFNQWVTDENPNLVSRIVFTNEIPKDGLNSIFNDRTVSANALVASYNFQAFKNPKDQPFDENKGMRAYNQFITRGLDSYVNNTTKGIDIPNNFSADSGGKLLMTASDMFNSFDVSFSAAYVQQYLKQTNNTNRDNVGMVQSDIDDVNLINNFIRAKATGTGAGDNETTATNTFSQKINNNSLLKTGEAGRTTDPYYNAYADLAAGTKDIHEIFEWNGMETVDSSESTNMKTNVMSKNMNASKFIFSRGKDGIHVMAIDGGDYYLNQSGMARDINKQKQFLAYRSLLRSSVNLSENERYDFDLNSQIRNHFTKNQTLNLYLALSKMYEDAMKNPMDKNNIFNIEDNANFSFRTSFKKVYDLVNDLVKTQVAYLNALNLDTEVKNIRAKIYDRAKGFEDNARTNQTANNGIAARLPYVRATDGSFNGLEQYYLSLYGLTATNASTGTVAEINKYVTDTRAARNAEIDKLLTKLNVETTLLNNQSQNTFVKVNSTDQDLNQWNGLYLAINLAVGSIISTSTLTNEIRIDYIRSNPNFRQFFNTTNNQVSSFEGISQDLLTNVIRNVFQLSAFNSLNDKTSYGIYTDFNSFNKVVDKAWADQISNPQQASDLTFSYYRFLYTFQWLLRNNLQNFKNIAMLNMRPGDVAFATWSLPINFNANVTTASNSQPLDDATTNNQTLNPLITFDQNPNGILGSSVANWQNMISSEAMKIKPANFWDNSSLTYNVSDSNNAPTMPQYGFAGLVFKNGSAPISNELKSALFSTYGSSGEQGAFYGFGSKTNLLTYVDNIKTERELDELARSITNETRVPNNTYFGNNSDGKPLSFDERVTEIKKMIDMIPAQAFERYVGYIGTTKSENFELNHSLFLQGSLRRVAAYVKQVSYNDLTNLGAGWLNDPTKALGLSPSELLTVIAMTASNSTVQIQAINHLTANNKLTVFDQRLYNALGTIFGRKLS